MTWVQDPLGVYVCVIEYIRYNSFFFNTLDFFIGRLLRRITTFWNYANYWEAKLLLFSL